MAEVVRTIIVRQFDYLCDHCNFPVSYSERAYRGEYARAEVEHEHLCESCGLIYYLPFAYPIRLDQK